MIPSDAIVHWVRYEPAYDDLGARLTIRYRPMIALSDHKEPIWAETAIEDEFRGAEAAKLAKVWCSPRLTIGGPM